MWNVYSYVPVMHGLVMHRKALLAPHNGVLGLIVDQLHRWSLAFVPEMQHLAYRSLHMSLMICLIYSCSCLPTQLEDVFVGLVQQAVHGMFQHVETEEANHRV